MYVGTVIYKISGSTPMKRSKVVVTGIGVVSPLGNNVPDFWKNLIEGNSGIKKIDIFSVPEYMSSIAGIVTDLFPGSRCVNAPYPYIDRMTLFAVHAIRQALLSANLQEEDLIKRMSRAGIVLSSAVGQIISMERVFRANTSNGVHELKLSSQFLHKNNPFSFNNIINELADIFSIRGRSLLLPTGCAGGVDAISYGVHAIRNNQCDLVIVGACEAPITPLVVAAFSKIGATSTRFNTEPTRASRPFDKDRDGFVLGEGCGILILESLQNAQGRGATILAEIAGVGSVNNCFHMTDIPQDGKSIAESSSAAIADAEISIDDVDFINSHGSSTPQNDIAETNAYKIVFGKKFNKIPVTSNKSLLGHALAASNALEIVSAIISINNNIVPPTINLESQDVNCDIDIVANVARATPIECVLKTSSGFSGIHSSLIIKKYQG